MHTSELELSIDEFHISDQSPIQGRTLMESNIRRDHDIIVIGIKRNEEEMQFNPRPDTTILSGDILIILGKECDISALKTEMR
ncbi:MAG: TrkA C-terminal domain-containing protein [Thermodesulfobacteriota bacterium]